MEKLSHFAQHANGHLIWEPEMSEQNTPEERTNQSDWQQLEPSNRLHLHYTTTYGNKSELTADVEQVQKTITTDHETVERATVLDREANRKYQISGSENGRLTVKKLGSGNGITVGHSGTATIEAGSLSNFNNKNAKTDSNDSIETITEAINDVWIGHNDFKEGGFEYVGWLIKQDIADMRADNWKEEECIEELADISINAIRMLIEQEYIPQRVILNRLENHKKKGTEELINKYQQRYADAPTDQKDDQHE